MTYVSDTTQYTHSAMYEVVSSVGRIADLSYLINKQTISLRDV